MATASGLALRAVVAGATGATGKCLVTARPRDPAGPALGAGRRLHPPARPGRERGAMTERMGRFLMLTGSGLSIIVFGLALAVHNTLYSNDLERAQQLGDDVRARLDGRPTARPGPGPEARATEGFETALREVPDRSQLDALLFYDEDERTAFAARRWPSDDLPAAMATSGLAPPRAVRADYEAGAVSVRWTLDPATADLAADGLLPGEQLGHRIYRTDAGAPPRLVATLGLETTRWRDDDMPLGGGTLAYEVWSVLLRAPLDEGGTPDLIRSESSELVTVPIPEHFRLMLVSGGRRAGRDQGGGRASLRACRSPRADPPPWRSA